MTKIRWVAAAAVAAVLGSAVSQPSAWADTTIDGCTVVAHPDSSHYTMCEGMNLAGANFSHLDFTDAYMDQDNLAGANFSYSTGGGYYWADNLSGANLSHAQMLYFSGGASLVDADMSYGSFGGCINGTDFTGVNLTGAFVSSLGDLGGYPCGLDGDRYGGAIITDSNILPQQRGLAYAHSAAGGPVSVYDGWGGDLLHCPSGSALYPAGTTRVGCTLDDRFAGHASGTYSVTVNKLPARIDAHRPTPAPASVTATVFGVDPASGPVNQPVFGGLEVSFFVLGSNQRACVALTNSNGVATCNGGAALLLQAGYTATFAGNSWLTSAIAHGPASA